MSVTVDLKMFTLLSPYLQPMSKKRMYRLRKKSGLIFEIIQNIVKNFKNYENLKFDLF